MAATGTTRLDTGSIKDADLNASAELSRSKLAKAALAAFHVPLTLLRVWDAPAEPLPSAGDLESGKAFASYAWDPNSADATFFTAARRWRVVDVRGRVEAVGTDAGAVTLAVKKAPSGTDIAAGTALHTGTLNLKGTVDTNQTLTLSATSADLDIAVGDSIGTDFTGVLTAARGTVTVMLAPAPSADDLLVYNGATGYGTNPPQVRTPDQKAAGSVTRRARVVVQVPYNYEPSPGGVQIRVVAGMATTVADTSATVDVEAYQLNSDGTLSADLVSTTAQSINSLTLASKAFTLDPTTLVAGSRLDVRISVAVNDAASGTSVFGVIQELSLNCDVRP